ncbi:cation diffusion facilitator family transporter [Hyphomicrobium sp.]|uniref:cation diffusion facilitator family transporter n=1 Tax=Hyphomicrobium sp. TaxID=82 RepID=UPI0025BDAB1C|nr:cation diffusion facilitator family transporter [Hyphomicrobium sp.]MCC7251809.1 cation transporter [Hyphomicrobium sp.]
MSAHSHSHAHSHDHAAHAAGASERRIGLAALLTGFFMAAEFAGGIISGSLALIADAGHMLTDSAGLTLAWLGFRLARRPADWKRSYGYDRFGVLVAFANGLLLFAIAGWIVVEAVHRFRAPSPVLGGVMFWVALAGLIVNLIAFRLLQGGDHGNLNVRAAALHVIGDLLGSVAALAAALVILATGWTPIDPILSVLVALLILGSAARIVRDAGHILLQGTPAGLDPHEIGETIKASVPEVRDVHHVHAWSLSQERPIITLHARVSDDVGAPETVTAAIKAHLKSRYGVDHATVELEFEHCADADKPHPRPRA